MLLVHVSIELGPLQELFATIPAFVWLAAFLSLLVRFYVRLQIHNHFTTNRAHFALSFSRALSITAGCLARLIFILFIVRTDDAVVLCFVVLINLVIFIITNLIVVFNAKHFHFELVVALMRSTARFVDAIENAIVVRIADLIHFVHVVVNVFNHINSAVHIAAVIVFVQCIDLHVHSILDFFQQFPLIVIGLHFL